MIQKWTKKLIIEAIDDLARKEYVQVKNLGELRQVLHLKAPIDWKDEKGEVTKRYTVLINKYLNELARVHEWNYLMSN